jgi:hypothetical protein
LTPPEEGLVDGRVLGVSSLKWRTFPVMPSSGFWEAADAPAATIGSSAAATAILRIAGIVYANPRTFQ